MRPLERGSLVTLGIAIGYATARAYDGKYGFAAFVLVAGLAYVLAMERWAPWRLR